MDQNPYESPKSPATSRLSPGCLWWLPWLALVFILGTALLALTSVVLLIAFKLESLAVVVRPFKSGGHSYGRPRRGPSD